MMRIELAAAIAIAGLAAALPANSGGSPAAAEGDRACVDAAIEAIQRRYESAQDLRARFVQTTRSAALGSRPGAQITTSGTVSFAKPGKMRWSYEEPEPSLVVSDGETMWIYDPAFREVQKLAVGERYLSGAAIQFLLGRGQMRRDFEVTAKSCAPRAAQLELVPREPAAYERLGVLADPATGELLVTTVVDLLGNVTEVAFSDLEINLDLDAALFRFDPPAGVRVIELEARPQ